MRSPNLTKYLVQLLLPLFLLLMSSASSADNKAKVLMLVAYEPLFPAAHEFVTKVDQALSHKLGAEKVHLQVAYLGLDLGPDKTSIELQTQLLKLQYQRYQYDIILAVGDAALSFVASQRQQIFQQTPVVFLDIHDAEKVNQLVGNLPLTGVMNTPPIYELFTFLRILYPDKKTYYFITDGLPQRAKYFQRVKNATHSLDVEIEELSLARYSWQELAGKLAQLHNEPIVLLSAFIDKNSEQRRLTQALKFLSEHSASPIWSLDTPGIGLGITGGMVNDYEASAELASRQVTSILAGTSPDDLPIHGHPPTHPLVDAQQALRYGFSLAQFPRSTVFINQPPSYWQQYGRYGMLALGVVVVILALLVFTFLQAKKVQQAKQKLQRRLLLMQRVLDAIPEMVFYKDINGRYLFSNQAFESITRKKPIGCTDYELFEQNLADLFRHHDQQAIHSASTHVNNEWVLDVNQRNCLLETHKTPIYSEAGKLLGILGYSRDITALVQTQKELEHIVQHDALTGLPNRMLLLQQLKSAILEARQEHQQLAVIYLDIDRFKDINDTLGHTIGDLLLKDIGHRLHNNIQQFDVCARIGSDEFVLVINHVYGYQQVQEKCEQLLAVLARPYSIQGHLLSIYASAGIALYAEDGADADTLIRHADAALHMAKHLGRNRCHRYTADLTEGLHLRIALEQDLHSAMESREFFLMYQPQFKVNESVPLRVETLIRWQHPQRGLISPVEFIPLAESSGMMVELGYWILRSACQQLLFWREQGLLLEKIAVNVSPVQITHSFANDVARILTSLEFKPEWLELEVTEGLMMSDTQIINDQINQLQAMGVDFAIDDFGTGYSSLSKLKAMPVSILKVDQSFVRNIDTDQNDFKIVQAIIQMAKSLKLTTVAEGVETQQHESILHNLGCDLMQGYFYAKPMLADQLYETYYPLINDDL